MPDASEPSRQAVNGRTASRRSGLKLWVAQGFGIGRIPFAPGTFGSLLGVGWFALLASAGNPWLLAGGTLAGFGLSVWLCGEAERDLGQKDPGSVVLDEVTAIPACFLGWAALLVWRRGALPPVDDFFSGKNALLTLAALVLFRFFDIVKPWPVRQSQRLPGGWGVTVDDFLAAVYVNLIMLLLLSMV